MDEKDKIILEHLFTYARFTTKQLGRITNLTQQAVHYKIKKLEERGNILRYDGIINWNILPLIKKIYYIKSQNPLNTIKDFEEEAPVFGINEVVGNFNLILWCFFKSKQQEKEFESKLKKYEWESIEVTKAIFPPLSVFNTVLKLEAPKLRKKKHKLDLADVKIMKYIANGNARKSIREIGESLNLSYDVAHYRLKNLIKSGYFFRLGAQIGLSSLDLKLSILTIRMKEKETSQVLEKLSSLSFFTAALTDNEQKIHIHIFAQDLEQYWKRVEEIMKILNNKHENVQNLHIKSTPLLNRYPLEYLLDKRLKNSLIV